MISVPVSGAAYFSRRSDLSLDLRDPDIQSRIAQQAAKVTKLVQLLGVVPILLGPPKALSLFQCIPTALVRLEALQRQKLRC